MRGQKKNREGTVDLNCAMLQEVANMLEHSQA